jgi:cardiolipin synthase
MTALPGEIEAAHVATAAQGVQSRALARSLELPVLGGNRIQLLHGRQQGWARVLDAIEHAADHINIEGPLPAGVTFDAWLERLATACRRGVHVNVMLEGSQSATAKGVAHRLRRVGLRVCEPAPVDSAWAWWHEGLDRHFHARTLVVVDGRTAFIGVLEPRSLADGAVASARSPRADVAPRLVCVEGPAVAELQWMFVDAWRQRVEGPMQGGRYFPPLPWLGQQRLGIAPGAAEAAPSSALRALLAALDAAQDSALLIDGDFPPAKALEGAVASACARGVDVHLLAGDGGPGLLGRPARRHSVQALQRAGAHLHLLKDAPSAACSVIDGVWSCIALGRARPDVGSRGDEDHLIVLDAAFAEQAQAAFWSDVERSIAPPSDSRAPPGALRRLNLRLAKYLEVGP